MHICTYIETLIAWHGLFYRMRKKSNTNRTNTALQDFQQDTELRVLFAARQKAELENKRSSGAKTC